MASKIGYLFAILILGLIGLAYFDQQRPKYRQPPEPPTPYCLERDRLGEEQFVLCETAVVKEVWTLYHEKEVYRVYYLEATDKNGKKMELRVPRIVGNTHAAGFPAGAEVKIGLNMGEFMLSPID